MILGQVSCGNHKADSCEYCPRGDFGATWCNGDCLWIEKTSTCVNKGKMSITLYECRNLHLINFRNIYFFTGVAHAPLQCVHATNSIHFITFQI